MFLISLIAMAAILLGGCLLQYVIYPNGYFADHTAKVRTVAEISSSRGVRMNEVMTANKTALSDDNGLYPDWIELINASSSAVDITGWALVDKSTRTNYFTFPRYTLGPNELVLVYASGTLDNQNGAASFHAPFRLSSAGDTLMLSDAHGTIVESINIPPLSSNESYARMDSGWAVTSEYTPRLANTSLNFAALTSTQPMMNNTLFINEIMANNASYPAADGGLYDWVELYNAGSAAVDLTGYGLSDTADKPSRWKFPSVTIQPGSYLLVYTSSLVQPNNSVLCADFGLRAEGERVLLYNISGQVLDHVEYDNLKTDQSLKRAADGSYTTSGMPSPGQAN